jgi:hypothetical protein
LDFRPKNFPKKRQIQYRTQGTPQERTYPAARMKNMIEYLRGKKTYLVALLGGLYAALIGLGVVPNYECVWGLLGAGGLAFLRAGVKAPAQQP